MSCVLKLLKPSLCLIVLSGILAACGGGGGSGSNSDAGSGSGGGSSSDGGSNSDGGSDSDGGSGSGSNPDSDEPSGRPDILVSAHLSWVIPSARENGDALALSEIDGYEIFYRKVDDELFTAIDVPNPTASDYEIRNLDAGTYEFKIAVYDNEGVFSGFSSTQVVELSGG